LTGVECYLVDIARKRDANRCCLCLHTVKQSANCNEND
jgi:hypothetical protein